MKYLTLLLLSIFNFYLLVLCFNCLSANNLIKNEIISNLEDNHKYKDIKWKNECKFDQNDGFYSDFYEYDKNDYYYSIYGTEKYISFVYHLYNDEDKKSFDYLPKIVYNINREVKNNNIYYDPIDLNIELSGIRIFNKNIIDECNIINGKYYSFKELEDKCNLIVVNKLKLEIDQLFKKKLNVNMDCEDNNNILSYFNFVNESTKYMVITSDTNVVYSLLLKDDINSNNNRDLNENNSILLIPSFLLILILIIII